ncbi:uncharacterized protein LOC123227360 isoform X3 [Mangifera indica]|uniref:uncharacterized protein LOC123227360 isoform X3 n=1 Tax=Mangifera indica TaxID=29780 RepID=UPI001CFAA1DC|nr:uncharacterized protein LOC123227360 isoform X3 [Mangifera indica]
MASDISGLEARYVDSCRKHDTLPNSTVLSWFSEAKIRHSCQQKCTFVVLLNKLKNADISPLIEMFREIDSSDIDAVDIIHRAPCCLKKEEIMSLMHAINQKLQLVDLGQMALTNDILRDLCHGGLACRVLNLRSTNIRKLNMDGKFMHLNTLNLDFCTSLTTFHEDCFSCMPNLMCLSMCETRISNLWTTTAALSKLPSIKELRFQNCLCCKHTGACPALSSENANGDATSVSGADVTNQASAVDDSIKDSENHHRYKNLSDTCTVELSSDLQRMNLFGLSSDAIPNLSGCVEIPNKILDNHKLLVGLHKQDVPIATSKLKTYSSHHPSPICFEKHYREYMVASLPRLEVLDNMRIVKMEREIGKYVFCKYFEYLPYGRKHKESMVNVLQKREIGISGAYCQNSSKLNKSNPCRKSQHSFSRSLSAAKLGSSAWPLIHPLSSFSHVYKEENKRLRPRQFEYHPSNSSLMAFGTLDGEVVVINHENRNISNYIPSIGVKNSVLGLCWLKKYPSKLIAGSDNGCLRLFDINHLPHTVADPWENSGVVTFKDFEQLTSIHVNSTDDRFLASGYSKNVALYDINSGKQLEVFTNMHGEPINVAKFAHHSPFLFATSSFDRDVKMWDLRQKPEQPCYTSSSSRGNVMVCFSPDDLYLLVSAVDNEVKQLLAADGRLHMNFDITSTGTAYNYTRSYYMNGRDYIISGSCDEHVVRICCAQTGRRLRDIYLEDGESGKFLSVQSLRGDPFRDFHMSVLAVSSRPSSKWEIMKVNLLASSHRAEEYSYSRPIRSSYCLGG